MTALEKINTLLADKTEEELEQYYLFLLAKASAESKKRNLTERQRKLLERMRKIREDNISVIPDDFDWEKEIAAAIEEKYGRAD